MKGNAYALVEAHVVGCRLHHHNSLLYSVALKTGKELAVSTDFYPSKDLAIQIDKRLALPVDKYSYEQFPKLTLIVNVIAENKEKKTVGTTFVNYKKQGLQTFHVSECSCKDKAFEVDISFTSKIIDPKSSNNRSPKNQTKPQLKTKYLSQQVTPRESRLLQNDAGLNALKQQAQGAISPKVYNLRGVKSEKKTKGLIQMQKKQQIPGKQGNQIQREAAVLSQKRLQYEKVVGDLVLLKQELEQQRKRNEILEQLLQIEQQKSREGNSYIQMLEQNLKKVLATELPRHHVASITSFKVIQQKDQIIMINQELQNELEREKLRTKALSLQLQQLKQNLDIALQKLTYAQTQLSIKQTTQKQQLQTKEINKDLSPGQILLSSRCIQGKFQASSLTPQEQKTNLLTQIDQLQLKFKDLKQQVAKLQSDKLQLERQLEKYKEQGKKMTQIPGKQTKKQENVKKNEKISKEKVYKSPPLRYSKKQAQGPPANAHTQSIKKQEQVSKSISSADKKTKVSTQTESKAQQEQSLGKSLDGVFNQIKSEVKAQVNQVVYYANTFQEEITNF